MDIKYLVNEQKEWFYKGKTFDVDFRIRQLKRIQSLVIDNIQGIELSLFEDIGKDPEEYYYSEILPLVDNIDSLIKTLKSKRYSAQKYYPNGVTLIICPFTLGFLSAMSELCYAIAAGNTVILKPSSKLSNTFSNLKCLMSSIFPDKYVCILENDFDKNQIKDVDFDFIRFMGNIKNAKKVAKIAQKNNIPSSISFGGKCPVYVDESADIEKCANDIIFAKSLDCGQTHFAPDYIYAHKNIKDKLIEALISSIETLIGSDPLVEEDYPKMISIDKYNKLLKLVDEKKVVYGGAKCKETLQIGPHIMTDISFDDKIMQDEILGPILPIVEIDSLPIIDLQWENIPEAIFIYTKYDFMADFFTSYSKIKNVCINTCSVQENILDNIIMYSRIVNISK